MESLLSDFVVFCVMVVSDKGASLDDDEPGGDRCILGNFGGNF